MLAAPKVFEEIVKAVIGDEVNSKTLANVYDEINHMLVVDEEYEDEEESMPTLDAKEVESVLKASGVKDVSTEKVERAFQQVVDDRTYEMKASHIISCEILTNYKAIDCKQNARESIDSKGILFRFSIEKIKGFAFLNLHPSKARY